MGGHDWTATLTELASLARETLGARAGLAAVFDRDPGRWSAWSADGRHLDHEALGTLPARAVLEAVRTTGGPYLANRQPSLNVPSADAPQPGPGSLLACPLWWREAGERSLRRVFGGVLFVERSSEESPLTIDDAELLGDLAAIAERPMSLLRNLRRKSEALGAIRAELELVRGEARRPHLDGRFEPRDPLYVDTVQRPLQRAARAGKVTVLLVGPTGSGKSHLAHTFHDQSKRRHGPFVVLDCGQVTSSEALGAELFGYAPRSGFAAPPEGRPGKARLADGGTLFIDEVGCLPLELQQRLLRLIQHGRVSPLGSGEETEVDIQVVAATNQNLDDLISQGRFREDLFWRLSELTLSVPPLDQRPADIPRFAEFFLGEACQRYERPEIRGFTAGAMTTLAAHGWSTSGNIRGLQHVVSRSVLLAPEGATFLDRDDLVFQVGPCPLGTRPCLAPKGEAVPDDPGHGDALIGLLQAKIREHQGSISRLSRDAEVAGALGVAVPVPASTLRLRLRRLALDRDLAAARQQANGDIAQIREALWRHGSAASAAASLGMSRDRLVWQLRKAGLTVRGVLAGKKD